MWALGIIFFLFLISITLTIFTKENLNRLNSELVTNDYSSKKSDNSIVISSFGE